MSSDSEDCTAVDRLYISAVHPVTCSLLLSEVPVNRLAISDIGGKCNVM